MSTNAASAPVPASKTAASPWAAAGAGSLLGLARALRPSSADLAPPLLATQQRAVHFLNRGLSWPTGKAESLDAGTQAALEQRSWRTEQSGHPSDAALAEAEALLVPYESDAVRLVFVDGQPAPSLGRHAMQPGVTLTSLDQREAAIDGASHQLGSCGLHTDEAFAALNTALLMHGAYVHVARATRITSPIAVTFVTTSFADNQLIQPRLLLCADELAEATIVERHLGCGDAIAWNNAVTEVICERGAQVCCLIEQAAPNKNFHMGTVGLRIAKDAHCKLTTFDAGSQLCRRSIRADLLAPSAEVSMWHTAMARGSAKATTHVTMRHVAGNTESRQVFKGVADGGGQVGFSGTVHIMPNAPKANAQQLSRGLLLSQTSKVSLRPQLIIFTDDVRCQHGATVGALDEQAMFYLQSRGLSAARAKELLTFAFLRDALIGVPQALQQPLVLRVAQWLGVGTEVAAESFEQP